MDKYINLDQLSIATQALLKKINEQSDLKVDRDEVISLNPFGDIIANIGGINIANGVKFNDVVNESGDSLVIDGKAVIPPAMQPIYVEKDSQEDIYHTSVSYNDINNIIQASGTSVFAFEENDDVNQIYKSYIGYFYQYVAQSQDKCYNFISFDYDEFNQNNNLKIYNWKFSLDTEIESNDPWSLPLIITKTELSTGGSGTSVQSDWEETDSTDPSYIENKPQIHKSVGNNSILLGDPTSLSNKPEFIVHITGDAKASVYTYSQDDDANIPESTTGYSNIICGVYTAEIDSIDKTTRTITLRNKQTISTSAASNKEATIYYQSIAARSGLVGGSTTSANASANSFAWGNHASSNGGYSFSFGQQVYANGTQSFALGGPNAISNGDSSLAVGGTVTATGDYSQAFGYGNVANKRSQLVFGRWNQYEANDDPTTYGTYVEIVGNGASISSKSNARTLDWSGNEVLAGKLTVGQGPVNNMDVTTKQYVDNAISQAGSGLPEVTNNDIGKALKVVQDTGDDIIPQQSITIQAGASSAVVQNYDITKFVAGTPVRLTLSNDDFTASFDSIISNNNDVTFYSEQDIEQENPVATISYGNNQLIFDQLWQTEESLELNIRLQTLEPQWQPDNINELPNSEIIPPIDETGWQWSNLGKSLIVNDSNIYNLIDEITLQSSDFVYNSDYGLYSTSLATDSENKFKPGNILTIGLLRDSEDQINQFDSQYTIIEATPGYPYNYYIYFSASIGVTSQGQIDLFLHSEPTSDITIKNINIIEPKWELQSSPIVFNFVEDTFNHMAEFDPLFYNTQTDIVTLSKQFRYFMHSNYPVQIHLRTSDSAGDTTNYILNKLPIVIGEDNPNFSTIITNANTNRIRIIKFTPNVRLNEGEYISIGNVSYYNYQLLPDTANDGDIMRYNSSSSSWQTASLPIYDGSVLINASGVYF